MEKQWLGGACLNVGCIPTKALLKRAEVFSLSGRAVDYGIAAVGQPGIDLNKYPGAKNEGRFTSGW